MQKLWNGRFTKNTRAIVDEFNASITFDKKLYSQDIAGSIAHAKMLAKQYIITEAEAEKIMSALNEIKEEIKSGKAELSITAEDIHMNIESILTEKIGDIGKKLHTARSRNDQVALDFKMYVKDEIIEISSILEDLLNTLLDLAEKYSVTVMPGYTHLQRAQPVTFGFHLMAYYNMFERDKSRFIDCYKRADYMPLGAGALAGTSYTTDRDFLARELGFDNITSNAMDSVSDRDFAIEFLSAASITMMHLSRFCEEIILWNSKEFSFIEIDDGFATGSSIMPQKKNPDVAELIRGKTGRVYGGLISLLTIMKGLPLAYNKDMQEDKPPVFDTSETVKNCLGIFNEMIKTITVKKNNMENAAKYGYMNATDAADYLVSKGLPFRECHEIIGKIVLDCINKGCAIEDLSLKDLQNYSDKFDEDIFAKLDIKACINAKKSKGSTSFESVACQIASKHNT